MNEEEFINLQSRIAFQEDTLNSLNDIVAQQSLEIHELRQQLQAVCKKFDEIKLDVSDSPKGSLDSFQPEKPPHY